jgi:hypothetical protein
MQKSAPLYTGGIIGHPPSTPSVLSVAGDGASPSHGTICPRTTQAGEGSRRREVSYAKSSQGRRAMAAGAKARLFMGRRHGYLGER